jgi:hypothetical protein
MPKRAEKMPTADELAEMADRGEDISRFFTGDGKMKPPLNKAGMHNNYTGTFTAQCTRDQEVSRCKNVRGRKQERIAPLFTRTT